MLPFDPTAYSLDPIALNLMIGWGLQKLKTDPRVSWLSEQTPKLLVAIRGVAALATAAGLTISWAYVDSSGGTITISGISLASVSSFLWSIAKNYAFQRAAESHMDVRLHTDAI